jgi:CheY-like chemotaxis protein
LKIEDSKIISGIPMIDSQPGMACSMIDLFTRYRTNRIMVVDDEEFCISALRSMLTKLGINQWQVDYCFDGQEALRCVKRAHETGMSYNLIFMDFNMPNMNGIEAAR